MQECIENFNKAFGIFQEAVKEVDVNRVLSYMVLVHSYEICFELAWKCLKDYYVDNNFGLPQRTIDELLAYFKAKTEIERVVVYGSRVKGTYYNGSDIDFAIFADENINLSKIAGELYDLPTPYKFNVVNYKTLSHENLKKSIDKDGIVFYIK